MHGSQETYGNVDQKGHLRCIVRKVMPWHWVLLYNLSIIFVDKNELFMYVSLKM